MSFSDILKAGDWKKVALAAYEEYFYPYAKEFVESSENSYDDAALAMVDKFLRDFLGE